MTRITDNPPPAHRNLVPISVAADYLNVSERTIRRRIADSTVKGYRFGRRAIRIDLAEVDAALRPIATTANGAS